MNDHRTVVRPLFAIALAALAVAGRTAPARAQSLSAGQVSGIVTDQSGQLLYDVSVALVDRVTGSHRTVISRLDGVYKFTLLLPGEYDLRVERFGYRARLISRIPVRAGSVIWIDVALTEAAADVVPDSIVFAGAPHGGVHFPLQGAAADDDFAAIVRQDPLLTSLSPLYPGGGDALEAAGLPGRLNATALDGVARWSPRHPRIPGAALDAIAFPLADVRGAELLRGGIDGEWIGGGGGLLAASTVPGARRAGGVFEASGGPDGGVVSIGISGALVRDTAHYAVGITAMRLNPELPAAWSDSNAAAMAGIARDSFLTDLSAYLQPWRPAMTTIAGFARFDGQVSPNHRLMVRASAATTTMDDPAMGPAVAPAIGARLEARDLSAMAELTSVITRVIGSELRLSVDIGDRDYTGAGLAGTVFTEGGLHAGSADLQPGVLKRTTIRGSETVHLRLMDRLVFKGGLQVSVATYEQTYTDGRDGIYYFGDSTGFQTRTGAFRQTVGSTPLAQFTVRTIGGFGQVMLRPVPGFEVLAALRYDDQRWPTDEIQLNSAWLTATGIDNRPVKRYRAQLSPRVAFNWSLGEGRRWHVHGETGLFPEELDPGVYAEAVTHATGASVRRAFGALGAWPAVPDSTVAPVRGQALSILGPEYEPPRTARAAFGITGNLSGTVLRLQSDYRHTEFLPIRRDLNLPVAPVARDQYGRVLYGSLTQSGSLLAAVPGTNRRFAGFDEVSALDPAGASDYLGLTVALSRSVSRGFSLMASYTWSRTKDNWFGARGDGAEAQFTPFADSTGRSAWARDRSDFDVPHRLVLGGELRFAGRAGARVAALYRWRSGYPFTPGFRDGVDANGDGSARNDPAFVTDTVAGADVVVGGTDCLRTQVGAFASRNSCRDPAASALDLRFAMTVLHFGTHAAELMVDGIGVVRSGEDLYDHALYLVDPTRTITTNAATSVTNVPLVANPNFGKPLVRRDPGAVFRVGLKVGF